MNTMCRNIIEKSVTGVLIYAGKRFVDKCFFDKKNEKKEKEVMLISNIIDKDIKSVPLKEIIERNKSQGELSKKRKLFAQGELHVISAPTGIGKSVLSGGLGWATAGGKESEHYKLIKNILGDDWDTTKQPVEYIDGENGEDELYDRYGRANMDCPDNFTVLLPGTLSNIDELEAYITRRAQENKSKGDYTIFIDQPRCYKGYYSHQRMQEFYVALKNIISDYRKGGYRLTIFIIEFLEADTFCKPVSCENIAGTKELKRKAHTIVALCPCRLGEEYCFLKVLKCRSYNPGKEVTVLKRNTDNGVFFHFAGKMQEEDALPLPARKPTASAASPVFGKDTLDTSCASVVPSVHELYEETTGAVKKVSCSSKKGKKVTLEILQRMKQLHNQKIPQQKIANILNLSRKTVNKYLQQINQGTCAWDLSSC